MAFKRKMQRKKVKRYYGTNRIGLYWHDWQKWHRTHPRRSIDQFLDGKNDSDWYIGAVRKIGEVKAK